MNPYRERILGLLGERTRWRAWSDGRAGGGAREAHRPERDVALLRRRASGRRGQILAHLADAEIGVGFRLRQALAEKDHVGPALRPGQVGRALRRTSTARRRARSFVRPARLERRAHQDALSAATSPAPTCIRERRAGVRRHHREDAGRPRPEPPRPARADRRAVRAARPPGVSLRDLRDRGVGARVLVARSEPPDRASGRPEGAGGPAASPAPRRTSGSTVSTWTRRRSRSRPLRRFNAFFTRRLQRRRAAAARRTFGCSSRPPTRASTPSGPCPPTAASSR